MKRSAGEKVGRGGNERRGRWEVQSPVCLHPCSSIGTDECHSSVLRVSRPLLVHLVPWIEVRVYSQNQRSLRLACTPDFHVASALHLSTPLSSIARSWALQNGWPRCKAPRVSKRSDMRSLENELSTCALLGVEITNGNYKLHMPRH